MARLRASQFYTLRDFFSRENLTRRKLKPLGLDLHKNGMRGFFGK